MKLIIQLNGKKKEAKKYLSIIRKACEMVLSSLGEKEKSFSILITDNRNIREYNKKFLNADYATDVIAFPSGERSSSYLGDIVISFEKAKEQAKIYKEEVKNELARLVIHGVLHLLGETDTTSKSKKRMWEKQEKVLKLLKQSNF